MNSKRRAVTTMRYVAADLGLDVRGGIFRRTHAEGRFNGVELRVDLVQDPQANGVGPVSTHSSTGPPRTRTGVVFDRSNWLVRATSTHTSLGAGILIRRASLPPRERDQETLVLTDDHEFDAAIHVTAEDRNHAHRLLAPGTRSVILAFFESGVEAEITDEQIEIMPQLTARALSSRLRNAARMSRLLQERLAELA